MKAQDIPWALSFMTQQAKMIKHTEINDKVLHAAIKQGRFLFGGNIKLKIYGRLDCLSGKRLGKANRVFFVSETEAVMQGYRPCGHCMNAAYKQWKHELI